jgi:hypothetical protein
MNISFCTVVLSLIQGIALNTGVLPLAKGGALHLFTVQLGTPRERYDEYSSKVFPQLKNQGMSIRRGTDKRLKVMLASLVTLQQGRR